MFSTSPPNLETKSTSFPIQKTKTIKNCVLLAGPGDSVFDKSKIIKLEQALKKQGANIIRIGDGESNLNDEAIDNVFHYLEDTSEPCLLFIMAHGILKRNKHFINLKGDFSTNFVEFLKAISSELQNKKIDIFSTACHGGAVCTKAQSILPSGSTYVALASTSKQVYDPDISRLIDILEKNNLLNGNLTAENLLLVYLTKALENRNPPMFCTSWSGAPLAKKFISHLGKTFSESEKKEIHSHLDNLADIDHINQLITIIEKSKNEFSSINAKQYGLALAICHSANRDLSFSLTRYQDNLTNIGLFTPRGVNHQPWIKVADPIMVTIAKKTASKGS